MGSNKLVPRKISRDVPEDVVKGDLERYKRASIEFGASDAKIVLAKDVVVDERVVMKCQVPRCYSFGESPNCPPYAPKPEEIRKVIGKYKYALLIKHDVEPIEDFADPRLWHEGHIDHYAKTMEIVGRLEALAFNDGYYLALGFAAGTCKIALCRGQLCKFLDSGRCRFPLKARPSMEAVGMDVYDIAAKAGWDVYPIGHEEVDPKVVPCAISVGIVFIH